jgi:hypothetical protein
LLLAAKAPQTETRDPHLSHPAWSRSCGGSEAGILRRLIQKDFHNTFRRMAAEGEAADPKAGAQDRVFSRLHALQRCQVSAS